MKKIIEYFCQQHLFTNFLFIMILVGGIFFWKITQKEELPEIALDFVRISVVYPGASPLDVERLVTWPIEKELSNVDGIADLLSTSSEGLCSIRVELERGIKNRDALVSEIRNTVLSVQLPDEVPETPRIREFKNTKKAIIDLGIYFPDKKFLSIKDRKKLQTITHTLENRLVNLVQINSINKSGYLKRELQILLDPKKLSRYRLSVRSVISAINRSNVRQPAGSLENAREERITLDGELIDKKKLEMLPVQGNFEGPLLLLKDVATIKDGFEKTGKVYKINGREGIFVNVVKNSAKGILESVDIVKEEVKKFQKQVARKHGINIIFFDDESKDVRNRIDIIRGNGIIGFILIITCLFIFLNFRAGFWVAVGIPFTFGFTLILANLAGYTINNITLASVIIVMGMVVDDAIVVSENVIRLESQGMPREQAVIEGTAYVLLPITASILTTCAAFLPLWAFGGRLSMFIEPIPSIVSLMLLSSLIESILILPAHLNLDIPRPLRIIFSLGTILLIEKRAKKKDKKPAIEGSNDELKGKLQWFQKIENTYVQIITYLLKFSPLVLVFFIVFTVIGGFIMIRSMKFTLFPREEVTEVRVRAEAPHGSRKYKTAYLVEKLENIFLAYLGKEVNGIITYIGMSHFGASAQENTIWVRVELKKLAERKKTFKELSKIWLSQMKALKTLENVRFSKRHYGASSGSPIEIIVQENDSTARQKVVSALMAEMKKNPNLVNIQTGQSFQSPEYSFSLKRGLLQRLGIQAEEVGILLRSVLNGTVLYGFLVGDEEKDVRLSVESRFKRKLNQVLNIPVHNNSGYLVPLKKLVSIKKTNAPQEIERINRQRITRVYADFKPESKVTPLEIADYLEKSVFTKMTNVSTTTNFSFDGEIKFTRESSGFFPIAMAMAILLIYFILSLQFQSLSRPFLILLTIPPAVASVIYVFMIHGMKVYGFFGIIGALGLAGVVVNDAIILIKKLNDSLRAARSGGRKGLSDTELANVSSTRLKAVLLTTITTVAGLFPTAYGILGYDSMLAEMMLALAWGLVFGTTITLILIPALYKILMGLENVSFGKKKFN